MHFHHLALSLALSTVALAASPEEWRNRSIYQVLTDRFARPDGSTTADCDESIGVYCGGTWKGIEGRLDYIQGLGFDAIWISPITKQVQEFTPYGEAYHGYWQENIYQVNPEFGTAFDLRDLADALHARGMYLMVDVVVNHFGYNGGPDEVDYSTFTPFNSESYFHDYCTIDYSDVTSTQVCWEGDTVVTLPDLRTEDAEVRDIWHNWVFDLVNSYGIDGLRLDTAKQVRKDFWPGFHSAGNSVYMVGEVWEGDPDFVCSYQDVLPGAMNFPLYFPMYEAFVSTSGSMWNFANRLNQMRSSCADTSLMGQFTENHDLPRFAGDQSDLALARNLLAANMLTDGIPIIYEGQEQHYNAPGGPNRNPFNREAIWTSGYNLNAPLAQYVASMNRFRKWGFSESGADFYNYDARAIYTDSRTVAIRKGKMISVLTNRGSNSGSRTVRISNELGVGPGTRMTELLTCNVRTIDNRGRLNVPMSNGAPRIYYPTDSLGGSGICNN